jgi:hypothetical protein
MFISVALTLSDISVSEFERACESGASEDREMTRMDGNEEKDCGMRLMFPCGSIESSMRIEIRDTPLHKQYNNLNRVSVSRLL